MRLVLTRDGVAAGDDCDAPHLEEIRLPDDANVEDAVSWIAASRYLPKSGGGEATWSIVSKRPIAVLAQQWAEPKMLLPIPYGLERLGYPNGELRVHAKYHAQQDPKMVFAALSRSGGGGF